MHRLAPSSRSSRNASERTSIVSQLQRVENERRKLLDAYYAGAVDVVTLRREQERINGQARRLQERLGGMSGGTESSTVRFDGAEGKTSGVYAGMQPLTASDIAESVHWAASQPAHVNVNTIELMPVDQSFASFQVYRRQR